MTLVWNVYALLPLAALVMAWGMAAFVYATRPDRTANRRLALQLVLEGITVSILGGVTWFITDLAVVSVLVTVALFAVWPKLWTYFNFLETLETPLAEPLAPRWRRLALLGVTLALGATVLVWPEAYALGLAETPFARWSVVPGYLWVPMTWLWASLWLTGLVFAVSAYRHAKTAASKEKTRWYLIAFGTRDVSFAVWAVTITLLPVTHPLWLLVFLMSSVIWIVYIPLVGYGILKHQLFDIDLKVKWTLEKSTIAAIFVAVFFVVSEGAQVLFADFAESELLGILAAGALVFAIAPLQRLAERVGDAAMPDVEDTSEYRRYRKMQVYEDTLAELLEDGEITDRDRIVLDRLRDELQLGDEAAQELERDVREDLGVAA